MNAASLPAVTEATRSRPPSFVAAEQRWPVAMLGAPIENLSIAVAVERIAGMVTVGRPHLVTLVTTARLLRIQEQPALLRQFAEADLVLFDSAALQVASWCFGNPLRTRVRPAELTRRLAQLAIVRGWRVFLLGSSWAEVAAAETRLRRDHDKLNVAGLFAPAEAGRFETQAAEHAIAAAKPDLLMVWSDAANVDGWLAARHQHLGVPVSLHFPGCSAPLRLDSRERAGPTATGRTWRERAANLWKLLPRLWQLRRCLSRASARGGGVHVVRAGEAWVDVIAGEALTRATLERQPGVWRYDVPPASNCAVDVSRVTRIDATGIAFLARHRAACRRANREFVLVAPNEAVSRALADSGLSELFDTVATAAEARRRARARTPGAALGVTRSLAWCGEILNGNQEDVWQMTSDYIRTFHAGGATLVIVDLARLRLIDAAGAALMLRVKTWARGLRVEVLFAHPQPPVANLLRFAGLDAFLLEGSQ